MHYRILSISFILLMLSACVSTNKHSAPVVDLDAAYAKQKGYYTVSAGETLYLISWRLDMNYEDLAKINHISSPYKLNVGEKIYLRGKKTVKLTPDKPASVKSLQQKSIAVKSTPTKIIPKHAASLNVKQEKTAATPIKFTTVKHWIWPVKGTVIGRYSQANKGINIAGKEGVNVVACAPGEVVYAGHGLRAYGNLLIIKHNDTYLSAYAHNENLIVKEGDYVKQGQVIAHLGSTGTTRPMLHFEIRKNGKPVDPLKYLP